MNMQVLNMNVRVQAIMMRLVAQRRSACICVSRFWHHKNASSTVYG